MAFYICVANVHMTMEAADNPKLAAIVNNAALVTPDGVPLVWGLKLLGLKDATRVYGPELTERLCAHAAEKGIPVGFYGGAASVLEAMVAKLKLKYPSLQVPYAYSPPFRKLISEEDEDVLKTIRQSGVKILFVGLGCPKQEHWMAEHTDRLPMPLLGVGAAFDFIAGKKKSAPSWMKRIGLEWLFRLLSEPRRLWYRYLYHNPRFVILFLLQLLRGGKSGS